MKTSFRRLIAMALVLCLVLPLATPAGAASRWGSSQSTGSSSFFGLILNTIDSIMDSIFGDDEDVPQTNGADNSSNKNNNAGNGNSSNKNNNANNSDKNNNSNKNNNNKNNNNKKPQTPTEAPTEAPIEAPVEIPTEAPAEAPTEAPVEKPVVTPSVDAGMELDLVEDQSTVSPKVMMRAAVYEASENDPVAQAELQGQNVVYYPSTFFDYDKDAIDQSMADLDVKYAVDHGLSTSASGWTWKGLYFGYGAIYASNGSSTPDRDKSRTGTYEIGEVTYSQATNVRYSSLYNGSTSVTNHETGYYYKEGENYYPVYATVTVGSGCNANTLTFVLKANDKEILNESIRNDTAIPATLTLYTKEAERITVTSEDYAPWVIWGQNDEAEYGGYIHSGLVSGLVDGVPQFDDSYAERLFDGSALNGKTRYDNVGLPFILDKDGYYTFDSSFNGAHFPGGKGASNVNLSLLDAPIVQNGFRSGSNKVWSTSFMPFNAPVSENTQNTTIHQTDGTTQNNAPAYRLEAIASGYNPPASYNHFFSMITNVAFTMTENGKMNPADDESDDILFQFSGDDDVWVFVDGVLVLDLGGVHDAVSGEINFTTNEITFQTAASGVASGDATGTYQTETAKGIYQGKVFNDEDGTGKLNTTRSTFAATDNHVLTIVYVERGANLSNCKIRFNLPQKDYISVTKNIDKNLYDPTDESTVVGEISDELFQTLNNRNFTFILYENNTPVANERFSRYDPEGNFVANGTTGSDGTFYLKNGESAMFYDVNFDGNHTYHIEELDPDTGSRNTWGNGRWVTLTNVAHYTGEGRVEQDGFVSTSVENAEGTTEAVDSINFISHNKLLNTLIDIANDEYVIDFGLPVKLNPLANDTSITSGSLELLGFSVSDNGNFMSETCTGKYGELAMGEDNSLVYTLKKQMTGADIFYYKVGLSTDDGEAVGKITIMPATTMYYEENFADLKLVTTDSIGGTQWVDVGEPQGDYQEEGRVGTTTDSPYGSDVLYKNNTGDSYGTSKYIDTTGGRASFSYTFTGTGTAFYARTSDKSAYLIITVTDGYGEEYRLNTIYKPTEDTQLTDNTLYNIPVYVFQAESYGTYTVNVEINKSMMVNGSYYRGCDFYLDGIRVYNPANAYTGESTDPDITTIENAYGRDGEAYITVDSLRNKLLLDSTKYSYVLDEEGNQVLDEYGDPVMELEWDGKNYVVFTDSNGEIKDAQTYQSAGPKEEVYMKNGQSIEFSLDNWDQNRNKVFLGIKAPSGSGVVSINGKTIDINNTTDIYYDITGYAEVSNNVATFVVKAESALISISTVKVTGSADFTIVSRGPAFPDGWEETFALERPTTEETEPEATEPEVTEPAVTEPEVTEPEVTEPEVTEPEVTEPEVTESEVTEPEVTEPEVTEPEVTEPEVTEPAVTEPAVTEPEVTEPEVSEPAATEPEATESRSAEPEATEPETPTGEEPETTE